MSTFRMAMIQMDSQNDKEANRTKIDRMLDEAAERGADFCCLSEEVTYIGLGEPAHADTIPGPFTEFFAEKARKHHYWLNCGSMIEKIPGNDKQVYNTSLVFNPQGEIVAKYRKIHMYDVDIPGGVSYKESDFHKRGDKVVTFDTEYGKMGLSVCYDMRFPELYRLLALKGAKVIFVPACYMMFTGKDHWDVIMRARAIENQCYIVAVDQIGIKKGLNNAQSYGRSLIADPWGNIIAKAPDRECVVCADIDMDYLEQVRRNLPSLSNRVPEAYK